MDRDNNFLFSYGLGNGSIVPWEELVKDDLHVFLNPADTSGRFCISCEEC